MCDKFVTKSLTRLMNKDSMLIREADCHDGAFRFRPDLIAVSPTNKTILIVDYAVAWELKQGRNRLEDVKAFKESKYGTESAIRAVRNRLRPRFGQKSDEWAIEVKGFIMGRNGFVPSFTQNCLDRMFALLTPKGRKSCDLRTLALDLMSSTARYITSSLGGDASEFVHSEQVITWEPPPKQRKLSQRERRKRPRQS